MCAVFLSHPYLDSSVTMNETKNFIANARLKSFYSHITDTKGIQHFAFKLLSTKQAITKSSLLVAQDAPSDKM
jgi:hypothetical protein